MNHPFQIYYQKPITGRVVKNIYLFAIVLVMTLNALANKSSDPESYESKGFTKASEFFAHQKNHIPGTEINTGIKTIYIAFNIWQRDDGSGNFTESDFIYEKLYEIERNMNNFFRSARPPSHPIEGVNYLSETNIRFSIKSIEFYRNSELYEATCTSASRMNEYVFNQHPHKQKYLNLHLSGGRCRGASGYANFPSKTNMAADSYVVSFVRDEGKDPENYGFWPYMTHLIHEIGHNLELNHPYDSEYCSFSHPDFLFDLFGFEKQEWCVNPRRNCDVCYQQGGWDCDLNNPDNTCTNNLMGGNKSSGSITPLQMGRMHRSLMMRSTRKYAWGYSETPYEVKHNEIWDFNTKFYQDIVVKSGMTLVIVKNLEMVPEAEIFLEPGAQLIVDGGKITNALYGDDLWRGITIEPVSKRGLAFWKPRIIAGSVKTLNDGVIENFKLGE